MECIICKKEINWYHKFLRVFYAPLGCNSSFVYKLTCSYTCWGIALNKLLKREIKLKLNPTIKYNEWVTPIRSRYYLDLAGDCGLNYSMDFRVKKGKIQLRVRRIR
jgi:hypothetical protein